MNEPFGEDPTPEAHPQEPEIVREDELDDANYQVKELFALYGLAAYTAQTLERASSTSPRSRKPLKRRGATTTRSSKASTDARWAGSSKSSNHTSATTPN
jgi:hypothetical protein